ncbi:MAG: aldo/keto reductase, partial [Bifidobacterium mongoliense]|nr:aldo/keto reductase [Bifidobacterium mongoliense]
ASERGQSLAEMSLAWLLRDPTVTSVLVGASRPEQILDDLGALNNMTFSDDELGRIETAVGTQSV